MAFVRFAAHYGDQSDPSSSSFAVEDNFEEVVYESSLDEGGKRKIMSVEFALQRECAYVRKVAKLVLEHHNDLPKFNFSIQPPTLNVKVGMDIRPPPENIPNLPAPQLQQAHPKRTLQIKQTENPSCLPLQPPPPQMRQPQPEMIFQGQQSEKCSFLPQPSQVQQTCAKKSLPIQQSESLLCLPPPQLQQFYAKKPLQSQQSENLSCLPPSQLQQSFAKKSLQIQPANSLSLLPPPQLKRSYTNNNLQIQPSEIPSCLPPTQMHHPYASQTLQTQSSDNLSFTVPTQVLQSYNKPSFQSRSSGKLSSIAPVQVQESFTNTTLQTQSSGNFSRSASIQMRQSHAKRKFQLQPISLVCKECQVPCSSATTLKKHYRGRKHRARVEELKIQNNAIQMLSVPNEVIEPLWCDICKIRCMNEDCFQQHLQGKKHASCVQAISCAKEAKRVVGVPSLGCGFLKVNRHHRG